MIDPRRRALLRGRLGVVAAAQAPAVQRPPWARPEQVFTQRCVRCHACVEACPRDVLKLGDGGFPEVSFAAQGCDFCGACAAACEPRALDRGGAGAAWPVWQARIGAQCLARQRIECRVCGDACAPRAIRFRPAPGGIARMQLDLAACTACGECVAVCPVGAAAVVCQDG